MRKVLAIKLLLALDAARGSGTMSREREIVENALDEIAAAEREACAKVADDAAHCMLQDFTMQGVIENNSRAIAHAIRSR